MRAIECEILTVVASPRADLEGPLPEAVGKTVAVSATFDTSKHRVVCEVNSMPPEKLQAHFSKYPTRCFMYTGHAGISCRGVSLSGNTVSYSATVNKPP